MSDTLAAILAEADVPVPKMRPETEEIVTPSGLVIRYEDAKHLYFLDDVRVPSVTSILGVLDKPALPWWGMKVGVQGVLALQEKGAFPLVPDADSVVSLLTEHKLTVNHVRDKAGQRGVTVHDALEKWALDGTVPNPDRWPDEQSGYVHGLVSFLEAAAPEPQQTEVMVGSRTHKYAGRYDLRCTIGERRLCTMLKKDAIVDSDFPGGRVLLDLKTTGNVYPEQFLQLEAYEVAGVECGYDPTDFRAVLHVTQDGLYQFRVSPASGEDFLAVKACYDATTALKERVKKAA